MSAMSRSWQQMFNTGDGAQPPADETPEERGGLFRRMRDSLSKSRRAMSQQLQAVVFNPADPEGWERLEEALIAADCGGPAAGEGVEGAGGAGGAPGPG